MMAPPNSNIGDFQAQDGKPVDWPKFAQLVNDHERFLLTSHVRPDCDALGSELGLAGVLEALGKKVRIVNGQATPPNFRFLDSGGKIEVIGETTSAAELQDTEVAIVLDTSAWAQLGPMADVIRDSKARKVIIDHHVNEDDMHAWLYKDVQAEATGRLVVEAADALGVELTEPIATPVFAALATDTGWFRFGSAKAPTYQLGARLIDAGANPPAIYGQLYERDTLGRVKLRGVILARIETELEGRLAHTHVVKRDFEETGALPSDTEDAVNMALAIEGTEVAVIMIEQASGGFKISFRSRRDVDCSDLASQFGGGGHRAAAGAFLEGPLEQVQPRILDAVRQAMR